MQQFLDWLNENGGALSVLFAAVVMIATVVYARLTAKLVDETRFLRKAQTEPRIEVFVRPNDHWINFLDICIKNIGAGAAYNIRLGISADSESVGTDELLARLQKLGCFKRGLAYLGPGQEFASFWDSLADGDPSKLQARFSVKCDYCDAFQNNYSNSSPLDLSELEGTTSIGDLPLHSIAKNIEKVRAVIESLVTRSKRLQVDAYSSEDRLKEGQVQSERIEHYRNPSPK